jgi:hypothetical protein
MKTLVKGLTLAALCVSTAIHANSFSAKQAGQGFTGLTKDFTSALSNPALLTKYDNDDDVYFSLNLGGIISDEHNVIDNGEDIANFIDKFEQSIDNIGNISPANLLTYKADLLAQVDRITETLAEIDLKPVQFREGVNLLIIVPNKHLSFGMFVNQYGRLGAIVDYDKSDEAILKTAIDTGEFDTNDLKSFAVGVGYSVVEVGAMFGYPLVKHADYDLSIGAKVKLQRIDIFFNNLNITDFDQDEFDLTDDNHLTDSEGSNVDLGLYATWGDERQWHGALVVNNISEHDVTLAEQNLTFTLETSVEAGVSYQNDWLTLAAEMDVVERESFKQLAPVKYASLGAEFRWAEHMQFRLGMRTDLNDNEADIYTLGIGISPWDIVSIDIAGFTGDKDTKGVALELSWKI